MFLKKPGYEKRIIKDLYTVWLPTVPDHNQIEGWELKRSDQFWRRKELPKFYNERRQEEIYIQDKERKLVEEGSMLRVKHFDPVLEKYRRQEWIRRIMGHWFMNNGIPTYITGSHYFYLQWCHFDHPENDGYPLFYENQLDRFYFRQMCWEDPWCLGYIIIGPRGTGKSSEEIGCIMESITKPPHNRHVALQSKTADDAKIVLFSEKTVPLFNELPDFFKPEYNHGSSPETKLVFRRESKVGEKAKKMKFGTEFELNSTVRFVSAKNKALDGKTAAEILNDEVGKCLKINTPIKMSDGSTKMVQDIIIGDLIMGPDNQPRKVLGLGRGNEMCYDVIPNKWNKWGCNESHILSLKWCCSGQKLNINGVKYYKEDTVNISIKDYLKLSAHAKKHLMLYKVGVEYQVKRDHKIPPYLLGLWLGDGISTRFKICKPDHEIRNYFKQHAESNGFNYVEKNQTDKVCIFYCLNDKGKNPYALKYSNLYKNKHIPHDYLIDTRKNRLSLLAGLIDTDGYKMKDTRGYEIVQKLKILADQINELASSLGFSTSIKKKVATMRRKDGSVYKCDVYRVTIFGDNIHEIPCLIERKKMYTVVNRHSNTRNPMRCGFKVVQTGLEDYYGFSIDGDHLFLLGDYQVTHNTDPAKEANVYERTNINTKVVYRNNMKRGLLRQTSTVEEMDKGGDECYEIWNESDPAVRDGNGYTTSKLYKYFISALETQTQYADQYGHIPNQTAYEFVMGERKPVEGDATKLSSVMRKNPISEEEAFIKDAAKCVFNVFIINARITELKQMMNMPGRVGKLGWVKGIEDGEVEFVDDPLTGKFTMWISPDFLEAGKNGRKIMNACTYTFDHRGKKLWLPCNDDLLSSGCDPIKFVRTDDPRASKMAAHGFWNFDHNFDDQHMPISEWRSHNLLWSYHGRSEDPEDDYEQVIMAMRLYGHSIMPESNVADFNKHLKSRGYDKFRILRRDFDESVLQQKKGIAQQESVQSVPEVQNTYIRMIKQFIQRHGMRINDIELLKQCRDFDPLKTTKFDRVISLGYTLLASEKRIKETESKEDQEMIRSIFPKFDVSGNRSRMMSNSESGGDILTINEVLGIPNR